MKTLRLLHQGTLGNTSYWVDREEGVVTVCLDEVTYNGKVFEREEFEDAYEVAWIGLDEHPDPRATKPPMTEQAALGLARKRKRARNNWNRDFQARKRELDKATGYWVPRVRNRAFGQAGITEEVDTELHRVKGWFEGAHSNDEWENWKADSMNGRGQGWHPNWTLRFDDD